MSTADTQTSPPPTTTRDPTQTTAVRQSFSGDARSRWRTVRGVIRDSIEHNDALRLSGDTRVGTLPMVTYDRSAKRPTTTALDLGTDDDAERIARLRSWLGTVIDTHVVEPVADDRAFAGAHWSSQYVSRAFAGGIARAGSILRQAGYTPVDTDSSPSTLVTTEPYRSALRRRRYLTYDDIRYAATVTRTKAVRAIADAIGTDLSPREAADTLTDRIDAIGRNRTDTAAESRVVDAYNQALTERYARAGVDRVAIMPETRPADESGERDREHRYRRRRQREHASPIGAAVAGAAAGVAIGAASAGGIPDAPSFEWSTAGDERVCERCQKRANETIRLRDIVLGNAERPPLHPRCRCLLLIA